MTHVELAVAAPAEAEETVAAVLAACGTTGAWIPRPGEVRGYFTAPSPDLESRFASHWRRMTGEDVAFPLQVRPVPGEDWLAGYRAAARPIRIGDRLRIVPSGCEPDGPAAGPVVRIEPGLGFGTGEHATTRALLRWIHDGGPFDRVLDVGTGSGILALAALAGGAIAAIGLEPDGMALENAARNRDLNRARGLALVRGSMDALAPGARFDLVLANLDATTLGRLASEAFSRPSNAPASSPSRIRFCAAWARRSGSRSPSASAPFSLPWPFDVFSHSSILSCEVFSHAAASSAATMQSAADREVMWHRATRGHDTNRAPARQTAGSICYGSPGWPGSDDP